MDPKELTDPKDRSFLRAIRDEHWRFMERVQEAGVLWWCIWNKKRLPQLADEWRSALIDGMEINHWLHDHAEWFQIGEWDEARYAVPVSLTDAGREALLNRHLYDMEPVKGGLVEPGFIGIPLPRDDQP